MKVKLIFIGGFEKKEEVLEMKKERVGRFKDYNNRFTKEIFG